MAWVLIGGYPQDVVIGTAVAGLNLIILSAAFGVILLFEARLWLRDVAIVQRARPGRPVPRSRSSSRSFGIASILWFSWSTVANAIALTLWLVVVIAHRTVHVRIHVESDRWWVWLQRGGPPGARRRARHRVLPHRHRDAVAARRPTRAVGTYSVGYKFSDLLGALPLAVVTPALTMLVAAWPDDPGAFRRTFRHALDHPRGRRGGGVRRASSSSPSRSSRCSTSERYADATDAAPPARRGPGPALLHPARVHDARRRRAQPALPDRDARRRRAQRRASTSS